MSETGTLPVVEPLVVDVYRAPFSDYFELTVTNSGHTEELEFEDTRAWFDSRGADMYQVEKALDYAYNFRRAQISIRNPIAPAPRADGLRV